MTCAEAVQADVKALGVLPPGCEALVALALSLAAEMDGANSATSKSMCGRVLLESMEDLRGLASAAGARDSIDELSAKRTKRRAAISS